MNDFRTFKLILLSIVKFNSEYDEIEIDDEGMYKLINRIDEFNLDFDLIIEETPSEEINENSKFYNLVQNKNNIFKFNWLTPKFLYEVNMKLPEINIIIVKDSVKINKFINSELLLFMFFNNFICWEFYICSYLVSIKEFRNFLNKSFSKKKQNMVQKTKTIQIVSLFNHEIKVKSYQEDENDLFYFHSYEEENFIKNGMLKLSSNFLWISIESKEDYKQFRFNFKQMKIIHKLHKYNDLDMFIKKIIIIDKKSNTLDIDYSFFDNIDESYFKFSKNFFGKDSASNSGIKFQNG